MPTITGPRPAAQFADNSRNEVTAMTEARTFAVAYTNSEGRKSMALVLVFGKDAEDGGPGIFVMAEESEMEQNLRMPSATIKKGVRKFLAEQSEVTEAPSSLTDVDVDEMGGTPTEGSVDVSDII
jgi:hypothetical protein